MKENLGAVIKASVITFVLYIAFYVLWGAVLNEIVNEKLKLVIIVLVSAFAFAYFLLRTVKSKKFIGERELLSDYKDSTYTSVIKDFRLAVRREAKLLICIVTVVFVCCLLHAIDKMLAFDKRVISLPTFIFAPMCLFTEVIKIPFVGYAVSAIVDCAAYIAVLLIYRIRTYKRLQKAGNEKRQKDE